MPFDLTPPQHGPRPIRIRAVSVAGIAWEFVITFARQPGDMIEPETPTLTPMQAAQVLADAGIPNPPEVMRAAVEKARMLGA